MNTRKNFGLSLLVGLWIVFANNSFGQEIPSLYYMNNLPQANGINPAIVTDSSKLVISIPGLSGFGVGLNSTFKLSDLLSREGSTLLVDFDKFYQAIPDKNNLSQSFSMPLLAVQYRKGNKNFSLGINERQFMRMGFDKKLIELIDLGNNHLIGTTHSTNFDFKFAHYREYALGYTDQVTDKIKVGGRLKFLTGFSSVDMVKSTLNIETDAEVEYVTVSTDGTTNVSAPVALVNDAKGKIDPDKIDMDDFDPVSYAMNFSNPGFAIDLGMTYQLNPKIELSGCINDLGTISWKKDVYNLTQDGTFKWEGVDISDATEENSPNSIENQLEPLGDSLITTFSASSKAASFSTSIPTHLSVGGKYTINSRFSAGMLDQLMIYKGVTLNTFSLLGNVQLGRTFSFSANYSIIGSSFANLGFGTAVKLGPIQLYAATNNILALNLPDAQNFTAKLGINIMIGNK